MQKEWRGAVRLRRSSRSARARRPRRGTPPSHGTGASGPAVATVPAAPVSRSRIAKIGVLATEGRAAQEPARPAREQRLKSLYGSARRPRRCTKSSGLSLGGLTASSIFRVRERPAGHRRSVRSPALRPLTGYKFSDRILLKRSSSSSTLSAAPAPHVDSGEAEVEFAYLTMLWQQLNVRAVSCSCPSASSMRCTRPPFFPRCPPPRGRAARVPDHVA